MTLCRGVPQIEITFWVDHNDLLHVKAVDKASNTSASKIINNIWFASPEEIYKMVDVIAEEQDKIDFLMNKQFSPSMCNLYI